MTAARLSTVAIVVALIMGSCEVPFDPTAPANSTPYVLCVLNPKDSAQYVRIQKSYICQENAYNFSSNVDSIYYPEKDLEVLLTRFDTLDGSIMEDPIRLYPTSEIRKNSGQFSSQGHYLFKTTRPIFAEFDYELSVRLIKEGMTVTSRLQPLGSRNFNDAYTTEQRKERYNLYHPERIEYYQDLTPSKYPLIMRFLYLELDGAKTTRKYIEHQPDYNQDSVSGEFDEMAFIGKDFLYRFIDSLIPEIPDIRRIAVGVDYMIQLADSNLLLFKQAEDPNSNFLYTPDFNNIRNGGVGLFASCYKLTIFGKALKPEEVDEIANGSITSKLNFADSRGKWK